MAYYLRIFKKEKGDYLQICRSYREPGHTHPISKNYKTLGYASDIIEKEKIKDPIAHYRKVVEELNESTVTASITKKVTDDKKLFNLGYFLPYSVLNSLGIKKYVDVLALTRQFQFSVSDVLVDLVCARFINPCSKLKTYNDVLSTMLLDVNYSLDQIYDCLDFIGEDYKKYTEILASSYKNIGYKLDAKYLLFDGTNYYFEIDKEDELRKKGPSKENRKDPIVSMGLLLDSNGLPIDMELFPGGASEKPILRKIVSDLKKKHEVKGRVIQIADKGLNCGDNIYEALIDGDGYIFSAGLLSKEASHDVQVKKSAETKDKAYWREFALNESNYVSVYDENRNLNFKYKAEVFDNVNYERTVIDENGKKKKEKYTVEKELRVVSFNPRLREKKLIELAKIKDKFYDLKANQKYKKGDYSAIGDYVQFVAVDKETGEVLEENTKIIPELKMDKIALEEKMAGYNMIASSEINLDPLKIYELYHQLWIIENTFRVMKTDLSARPVYLQKETTIYAHFVIIFYAVAVLRLLQLHLLKEEDVVSVKTNEIIDFIRNYNVFKLEDQSDGFYINVMSKKDIPVKISSIKGLDKIDNYWVSPKMIGQFKKFDWRTLQKA